MTTRIPLLHLAGPVTLAALLAAGCAPVRQDPPDVEESARPAAALRAQRWLADRMDVPPGDVEISGSERREWTDSCLGLGGPAESCLAVMTPGWLVMLEVDGRRYEVRTDETGRAIRSPDLPAEPPGPPGEAAPSDRAVRLDQEPARQKRP